MSERIYGYGCDSANDETARRWRRKAMASVPVPVVTEEWIVEDRRDKALTCWPYRIGAR